MASELQAKIELYEVQLGQVQNLLSSQPDNEKYLKMQSDMTTLIDTTRKILEIHNAKEASENSQSSKLVDGEHEAEAITFTLDTTGEQDSTQGQSGDTSSWKETVSVGDIVAVQADASGRKYAAYILSIATPYVLSIKINNKGSHNGSEEEKEKEKNNSASTDSDAKDISVVYFEYPTMTIPMNWDLVYPLDYFKSEFVEVPHVIEEGWHGYCR